MTDEIDDAAHLGPHSHKYCDCHTMLIPDSVNLGIKAAAILLAKYSGHPEDHWPAYYAMAGGIIREAAKHDRPIAAKPNDE